ncbi:MAG: alanine racemase [Firmicutes bacterium]|nr:alanine racemase [Bacillota bacterium]
MFVDLRLRTAAVVHLDLLAANIENIKARLKPGTDLIAVIKGDAYGHGIAGIYPTMKAAGIRKYAVAVWEEGRELREAGASDEDIYLLGDTWDDQLPELIKWNLIPAIFSVETAARLNQLCEAAGTVHPIDIAIDTGMSRIGFPYGERAVPAFEAISRMKNLKIIGAFTHFARADESDGKAMHQQLKRYQETITKLGEAGIRIPLAHTANSPAILLWPETQLDAVRAGDVLFGLCPVDEEIWPQQHLSEVMTWHTHVAMVKTVPAGTEVGYGGTYTTSSETRIATIPVGFADGYSRRLSNLGWVTIRGKKAPIIGRVCMDQFMVDVTDIPKAQRGDIVDLLGGEMSILEMSKLLDQNVDEIVSMVSKRVPRLYTSGE